MAKTGKSIIDEAFMEAEAIERAFEVNSKEILAHTMGSDIEEMVKESLKGSADLNEDEDDEDVDLELDLDSDEAGLNAGDDLDLELGDGDMDMDFDLEMDDEDMDMDDDLDVIDLTGEDDETVVTVFKKMAPEDEIEVIQTGDGVEIKDNATGAEYKINLGGGSSMEDMDDMDDMDDMEDMDDMGDMEDMDDMDDMDDEVEYQIELDDEEEEIEEGRFPRTLGKAAKLPNRKSSSIGDNRRNMGESIRRTESRRVNPPSKLINENKVLKNKINSIVTENETLKEDYNKMVDALKEFRQKLNEVAIFNSNLTYTVRLFTEHSTTKSEKVDIIKRFDDVKSLKESKNTYKNLVKEISKTNTPLKESIDNKLNQTKSSGSATEITESKVYVDPQLQNMKRLWEYQYKH